VAEFNHTSREPYQLSVSIGIARHEDGLRICLDELIAEADNAMYKEKHSKRSAVLRQS
jgi:PleD family two-component response regulator